LRGNINAAIDGIGNGESLYKQSRNVIAEFDPSGVAGRQDPMVANQPTYQTSVTAAGEAQVSKGIRQMTGGGPAQPVAGDVAPPSTAAAPIVNPRLPGAPPTHPGSRI
jgi:hypothetical protein